MNKHVFPTREQLVIVISLMWPWLVADWIAGRVRGLAGWVRTAAGAGVLRQRAFGRRTQGGGEF